MLTERQKEIFDFVNKTIATKGIAPTHQEIAKRLKLRSVATVHEHLQALEKKGYLKKLRGQARGMQTNASTGRLVSIPLLGVIAAGQPIETLPMNESIAVPADKIPQTGNLFALTVQGESMLEEHIHDGDTILVRQQETARDGDTVVALVDGEATVKKLYREGVKIRLQPANKRFTPLLVAAQDLQIQGIVIDVIRHASETPKILSKKKEPSRPAQKQISPLATGKKNNASYELYCGDALEVIPRLKQEYSTIYLDPPFNSNRAYTYSASGEDFGFSDTWADGEYEQWIDRLLGVCASKLSKDGTLFFHISAELSLSPHLILHKHFKKVEPIFWKKAHGKNTVKNKMGSVVDIIFKASNNGSKFNLQYVPLDPYYFENSYVNKDSRGLYALGSLKHDKTRQGHMYSIERDGITYTTPYGWKISKDRLLQLIKEDRIHFARPKPGTKISVVYKKLYKHETKGKPLSNLWDDIAYITRTTKDQRLYPTQKPLDLLKRIVTLSSDEGDWVLDPVAGSGTTGAAALALGRNTTLIDVSKDAARIVRDRLKA